MTSQPSDPEVPSTHQTRSLSAVPFFRGLDPSSLKALEATCVWLNIAAGQWIIGQQEESCEVFFVIRGHLRAMTMIAGREAILDDLRDGGLAGELAAIDRRPQPVGVLAVAPSTVARMPASAFQQAIHDHASMRDQVLSLLAGRTQALIAKLNEAAGLPMRYRLMSELLRLSRREAVGGGERMVSPPPTHVELAARIGSQREAVTRELNAMERGGLISRHRGSITLSDCDALRRLVNDAMSR